MLELAILMARHVTETVVSDAMTVANVSDATMDATEPLAIAIVVKYPEGNRTKS